MLREVKFELVLLVGFDGMYPIQLFLQQAVQLYILIIPNWLAHSLQYKVFSLKESFQCTSLNRAYENDKQNTCSALFTAAGHLHLACMHMYDSLTEHACQTCKCTHLAMTNVCSSSPIGSQNLDRRFSWVTFMITTCP